MDENLIGHLLKSNDVGTQAEVEQLLANDPIARHKLELLKQALAPLAADHEEMVPPANLWMRTLERVAFEIVAKEGHAQRDPVTPLPPKKVTIQSASTAPVILPSMQVNDARVFTPPHRNILAILFLTASLFAVVFPAIAYLRTQSMRATCQNSMEKFYQSIVQYSDANEGNFPQVNTGENVAHMASSLKLAGYLNPDEKLLCPAAENNSSPILLANYAYCLGYRDPQGNLCGLKRGMGADMLPILSDAPLREQDKTIPINHRRGQNVLTVDGQVRFCSSFKVGVEGDDIYRNEVGLVGAGLHKFDSVLGRTEDQP